MQDMRLNSVRGDSSNGLGVIVSGKVTLLRMTNYVEEQESA